MSPLDINAYLQSVGITWQLRSVVLSGHRWTFLRDSRLLLGILLGGTELSRGTE